MMPIHFIHIALSNCWILWCIWLSIYIVWVSLLRSFSHALSLSSFPARLLASIAFSPFLYFSLSLSIYLPSLSSLFPILLSLFLFPLFHLLSCLLSLQSSPYIPLLPMHTPILNLSSTVSSVVAQWNSYVACDKFFSWKAMNFCHDVICNSLKPDVKQRFIWSVQQVTEHIFHIQ